MSKMITQSTLTVNGIDLKTPDLLEPPPRVTVGTPPEKLIVVCVWWGTLYPVEYVEKLKNSVKRNLSIPHEFVCITDNEVPEGVTKIKPPLSDANKGWWQKVGLFHSDLFPSDSRILYLDLDVVIVGSLDNIASAQEPFCMIENYGPNKAHAAHNSSVMVWTPNEKTHRIYNNFSPDIMTHLHGDQCAIWRVLRDDIWDFSQNWIVSYKYEKIPQWKHADDDTAIIVFHGQPKPADVIDQKIKDNWK